jgi:hypothetical protein
MANRVRDWRPEPVAGHAPDDSAWAAPSDLRVSPISARLSGVTEFCARSGLSACWEWPVALLLFLPLCAFSQSIPAGFAQNCTLKEQGESLTHGSPSVNANIDPMPANGGIGLGVIDNLIHSLRNESFPQLANVDLGVRSFRSKSDYFRTRFRLSRFALFMRMRYYIEVNPALFQEQPPSDGVCAILAHELSHVVSLSRGNRLRRFSLVRLLSRRYTAKFERGTDLEAIHRGYGNGLKSYRVWVYAHVPPDKLEAKLRNYFSPDEIAAIQMKLQGHPELFSYWTKHVPENLEQIENSPI